MKEFYAALAEILEEDTVESGAVLEDFEEWDSLSVLTVVAMIGKKFEVTISAQEIAAIKTAGELWALVEMKCNGVYK
jgi:acyl carrier protein